MVFSRPPAWAYTASAHCFYTRFYTQPRFCMQALARSFCRINPASRVLLAIKVRQGQARSGFAQPDDDIDVNDFGPGRCFGYTGHGYRIVRQINQPFFFFKIEMAVI